METPKLWTRNLDTALLADLRLDQLREQRERVLPAEITGFRRDGGGYAFLHDVHFRPQRYGLQRHGDRHHARQVGIVELVGMADALVGHQLEILPAERMAVAGGE